MSRVWPNLFVIGAAKCGTTSLAYYLSQHPQIFMTKLKEPHYFSRVRPSGVFAHAIPVVSNERDYLDLFVGSAQFRYRGEASTSYLWSPEAVGRIADHCPDARIVAVLREPIARLYSHYLNEVREGVETRPVEQAVREDCEFRAGRWGVHHLYVECGLYSRQLARYLDEFPREQIMVLFQEELRDHPVEVLTRLMTFLGLDPRPVAQFDLTPRNTYRAPRYGLLGQVRASPLARTAYRRMVPVAVRMVLRERLMFRKAPKPPLPEDALNFLRDLYSEELRHFPPGFEPVPSWIARQRGLADAA
jgi:hypothetical protein